VSEFKREQRYVVLKIKDLLAHVPPAMIEQVDVVGQMIAEGRARDGKPPFNAVVVEQDWPEFDLIWEIIEARMSGEGNDLRRVTACVNACAGINTDALESWVNPPEDGMGANVGTWPEHIIALDKIARAMESQRDELLADKDRLDWLESNPRHAQIMVDELVTNCVFYGISCAELTRLRDAIDAAKVGAGETAVVRT
jgi:hypothetical protein